MTINKDNTTSRPLLILEPSLSVATSVNIQHLDKEIPPTSQSTSSIGEGHSNYTDDFTSTLTITVQIFGEGTEGACRVYFQYE